MKLIAQDPGGRKYVGDDFLAMQDLFMNLMRGLLSQFGDCIVYGCEFLDNGAGGTKLSAGVVCIDGDLYSIEETDNTGPPFSFITIKETINVPYKTGTGIGYVIHKTAQAPITNPPKPGVQILSSMQRFGTLLINAN